jgi:hypothetical protein
MKYYKIAIKPFDPIAHSRVIVLRGHDIGDFYILDTKFSKDQLESDLRQTAESVVIIEITKAEFESLSREKLGFCALNPE